MANIYTLFVTLLFTVFPFTLGVYSSSCFFLLHNCEICQFTQEKLDLAFTLQDISINFHFSLITRAYAVVYIYSTFLFSHFAPLHVEICFKKLEELFNLFFFSTPTAEFICLSTRK